MTVFNEGQLLDNILKVKTSLEEETINLFCCVNDKLVNPMINLMYSIRHFCDKKLKLFILTTALSPNLIEVIQEKLSYIEVETWIKQVENSSHDTHESKWSLDVYLKVFGFEYLPNDIDKVLYLDAGILALDDISKIYKTDVSGVLMAAMIDVDVNHPLVFQRRIDFSISHDYFNAGVLLYNLKKQREVWSYKFLNNEINEKNFPYNDQDLLNSLCKEEDVIILPYSGNFQSWWEIKNKKCLEILKPTLVQFINNQKPWVERNFDYYTTTLFFECAALTHLPEYCPGEYFEDRLQRNISWSKTSKDTKEINLLCCVNDAYSNPMINLMYSIRQYNSDRINLYVLSTSLSEETQERIHKMGDKINIKTNIKLCELPDLYIGEAYWSLDMYLRVLAFEYLPKELDKILYLDADVQAFDDIAPIYEMDISNHVLSARKEPWRESFDKMMNSIKDNNFDHEYFSSGLMLFNLKKMRELWSKEKVFETIKSLKLYFPDQDTLNKLCKKDDILDMPDRYNFYDLWLMVKYQDVIKKAPIILHYVSGGKPWNVETPNYEQTFFFRSAKFTGIQEYIDKGKKFGLI